MIRRTLTVAIKELLQLKRDPRSTLTLLGMPIFLLLIYGFALSFDIHHIRLAIVDHDGTQAARDLSEAFLESGYFDLVSRGHDERVINKLLDQGTAQAAIVIPERYGADLAAARPTDVQFVLDGSDSQTATTILSYARQIIGSISPVLRAKGAEGPIAPLPLVWYNPDLSSSRFLVPGLIAFILMITTVIATSLAVVREKERGTMESLRATPLVAIELLLGKTLPYLVLASASAAGSLYLSNVLFNVPLRGSWIWLAVVTLLFLLGGLGWGVFISTLADTQQVAFQMGLLSTMLPTLVLSGFVFPISSMPKAVQVITHIVPARYYLVALRDIVLKGVGPTYWWGEAASLGIFAVCVLALATVRTIRSL